jgi:hypothetical protein
MASVAQASLRFHATDIQKVMLWDRAQCYGMGYLTRSVRPTLCQQLFDDLRRFDSS